MNTFGMFYGAMFVALYAVLAGQPFRIDLSQRYLLSLAYLTLLGSVVAFSAFLTLLGRIGADRAGYVTVAVPVVALLISGLFEGLHWNPLLVLGVLLCLAGNISVLGLKRGSRSRPDIAAALSLASNASAAQIQVVPPTGQVST